MLGPEAKANIVWWRIWGGLKKNVWIWSPVVKYCAGKVRLMFCIFHSVACPFWYVVRYCGKKYRYCPWIIHNAIGHGRPRDPKRGRAVNRLWVIVNELGHGGSGDQKRGLDMKAATLSSLRLCSTHCVPISANCRHNATCRDYLNNNGP